MPIPELLLRKAEKQIRTFCEQRIPPHIRREVRLSHSIRGNNITLSEERPVFKQPDQWSNRPVAQFRYDVSANQWSLYCADRNSKWHRYSEPLPNLDELLSEVDKDPSGIFWG